MDTFTFSMPSLVRSPAKEKGSDPQGYTLDDETSMADQLPLEAILCRQCQSPVTTTAEQITVQGSHQHTFANPEGILFQIGCFAEAPGCIAVGEPTEKWTWFTGFLWRVDLCVTCFSHLGWVYDAAVGEHFHGLILERLLFPSDRR